LGQWSRKQANLGLRIKFRQQLIVRRIIQIDYCIKIGRTLHGTKYTHHKLKYMLAQHCNEGQHWEMVKNSYIVLNTVNNLP